MRQPVRSSRILCRRSSPSRRAAASPTTWSRSAAPAASRACSTRRRTSRRTVVGEVHGLLLTGGADIDPARYGEARHATVTAIEPERDEFEFALAARGRAARPAGLRDLPRAAGDERRVRRHARAGHRRRRRPAPCRTRCRRPPCAIAHEVWVSKGSRLWTLMQEKMVDADTCSVNSRHHQAIKTSAPRASR